MSETPQPLVILEPGGPATIIKYDLPEPTIYTGRNFIELDYALDFFTEKAFEKPPPDKRTPVKGLDPNTLLGAVENAMATGFADEKLFPNVKLGTTALRFNEKPNPAFQAASDVPLSPKLSELDASEVATQMQAGKRLNVYTSMFGTLTYNYIKDPVEREAKPRLLLVETYRLSSFLGSYGAGRTVKTFTLLPGEKTKASVRTFVKTEEQRKQASSILDSFTEESSKDFENSIAEEQTDKETYERNFEYYAEAQAKASWGWGSAKVKGGVKGGSNSAREEFSKSVSTSVEKHAMKASAKRNVEINTSYEVTETEEQETSIEREIENINLSRTMNFVFRQMNQEFITVLSLIDVRLAFFNEFAETRREVTLPEMSTLLDEYIVDEEDKRSQVEKDIIDALENILDHRDDLQNIVEEKVIDADNRYFRVKKDVVSTHKDPITGTEITVPGIILSVMTNVLRTEGVIVETILGIGDALDAYATRLQELEVARREAEMAGEAAKAATAQLLNEVVRDNDAKRARLLIDLTCPCGPERGSLDINIWHKDASKTVERRHDDAS
jgi:hypothetical protein